MFYFNRFPLFISLSFGLIFSFFFSSSLLAQTVSDSIAPSNDFTLPFNLVATGQQSGAETITLTNPSSIASFKISQIQLTGPDSGAFALNINGGTSPCGSTSPTLPAGGSCTLTLRFVPDGVGLQTAFLNLSLGPAMIAFHNTAPGKKGISLYNISTKETTDLSTPGTGLEDSGPTWSPDGGAIVFNRHVPGSDFSGDLMTVPVDQSVAPLTLVNNAGTPAWSPDGKKIAYRDNQIGGIRIFDFDEGISEQSFGSAASGGLRDPSWSPNGDVLVFHRQLLVTGNEISSATLTFDSSGVFISESEIPEPLSENGRTPAWSSDGQKIAFQNTVSNKIHTINAESGTSLPLIPSPPAGTDKDPSWSPDSNQIVFHRLVSAQDRIMIINADGSGEQAPISTTGRTPAWSPDLPQLILSGTGLTLGENSPPSVPQLVAPEDLAENVDRPVTLSWFPSSDPENHAIHYQFTVCETAGVVDCSPKTVQLAKSEQENGVMFAGIASLFFAISLIAVTGKKKSILSLFVLIFVSQFLLLACGGSGSGGGNNGNNPSGPKPLTHVVEGLDAGKTYFWQIIAIDALGEETESEVRQFKT